MGSGLSVGMLEDAPGAAEWLAGEGLDVVARRTDILHIRSVLVDLHSGPSAEGAGPGSAGEARRAALRFSLPSRGFPCPPCAPTPPSIPPPSRPRRRPPRSWPTSPCSARTAVPPRRHRRRGHEAGPDPTAGWSGRSTCPTAATSCTTSAGTPAARTSAPGRRTPTSSGAIWSCPGSTRPASTSSIPSPIPGGPSW